MIPPGPGRSVAGLRKPRASGDDPGRPIYARPRKLRKPRASGDDPEVPLLPVRGSA